MKYIFIFTTLVVFVVGILLYLASPSASTDPSQNGTGTPFPPTNVTFPGIGTSTQPIVPPAPVTVNFQLRDNPEMAQVVFERLRDVWQSYDFEGIILGVSNDDWQVQYAHEYRTLTIRVSGYPGLEHQKAAEQALLEGLQMTPEEVCGLGVEVVWKNYDTQFKNEPKKLTFCE